MFWCVTSNVIYTLITHAQEPIKLLHSYALFYKYICPAMSICYVLYNYHLFTETKGNSEFCGPETAVVARSEAEGNNERSRGHKTHCFPEVSVNKCFVI